MIHNYRMNIVTKRDLIKHVLIRWQKQYHHKYEYLPEKKTIEIELSKLDLNIVDSDIIEDIIGNFSWTREHCSCCGEYVSNYVEFEDSINLDRTINICFSCLDKMKELRDNN